MTRVLACLLGLSIGIASIGAASAQDGGSPATVVDLPDRERRGGQGQDGREVARGDDGDSITYTIVESPDPNAGDATTAVVPPPAAPDLSRVPVQPDAGETTVAPPTGEPASAPIPASPEPAVTGDATTLPPDGAAAPPAVTCAGFGTWYDAQVYYESAGGLAAAPELVSILDADVDGVACEDLITYA